MVSFSGQSGFGLSQDLLTGWYSTRRGASGVSLNSALGISNRNNEPEAIPPWDSSRLQPTTEERLRDALGGGKFVDEDAAQLISKDASESEQKLFALYSALAKLSAIAGNASDKETPSVLLNGLNRRFSAGLEEVFAYAQTVQADDLVVIAGAKERKFDAELQVPRSISEYTTKVIHRKVLGEPMEGVTGSEIFSIDVTKFGISTNVTVDLGVLGSSNVSMNDMIGVMNDAMEAAGIVTRFKTERVFSLDEDGKEPSPLPQAWAIKIDGNDSEKISFSSPTAGTSVFVSGNSGKTGETAAQFLKLDASGATTTQITSGRVEATSDADEEAATKASASAMDTDGNLYIVGTSEGTLGAHLLQGKEDAFLSKYDSAGNLVWQKLLGSADEAQGYAVSTDPTGGVVVSGRATGSLNGGTTSSDNGSSFVTKFTDDGQEVFTRHLGPYAEDRATAVVVADDGSIYFAGKTKSAISSGQTYGGGEDAFITKLTSTGNLEYSRQFGGAGNERITNLAIADDGNIVALTMEDGNAVVRKFDAADGVSGPLWEQNLGNLAGGDAAGLAVDGTDIYVAGWTQTSGIGGGTTQGGYQGGADGFLVKLNTGGNIASTTYIGTASTDRVRSVAAVGGEVFVAGDTTGDFGGGVIGSVNGFAAKVGAGGALDWVHQYSGRNGQARAVSIQVNQTGSSFLDRLGLPSGEIDYTPSRAVTAQSTVRAGQEFYISVDGGAKRKIVIDDDDTVRALTFKINAVLLLDGQAKVRRFQGNDMLRIEPRGDSRIDLIAGAEGKDALRGLGLAEGSIIDDGLNIDDDGEIEDKTGPIYVGLQLLSNLSFSTRDEAAKLNELIQEAMSSLRGAFRDLNKDPALDALLNKGKKGGTVPPHLTAQLANYQAGLNRLQGGGTTA